MRQKKRSGLPLSRAAGRSRLRGSAIVGAVFFTLITSILLVGIGTYAVTHQTRAKADSDYARVLDMAEAGLNYELRKITANPSSADQYPGTTYTLGGSSYTVYCKNQDGTTPWNTSSTTLHIFSVGTVNGVSRTIRIGARTSGSGSAWVSPLPSGVAPVVGLLLTSIPSPSPATKRLWRVRNTDNYDKVYTWDVYGTTQNSTNVPNYDGSFVYIAKANSDNYFWTNTIPPTPGHPNTTRIFWNASAYGGTGSNTKASSTATSSTLPYGSGGSFSSDNTWVEINPR